MAHVSEAQNADFYPDVVAVCGNPVFYDAAKDTILNPVAIVEVLSPSTASFDRGAKWDCYRTLDALHIYMLVSQLKPQVELYTRTDKPDHWDYQIVTDRGGVLQLPRIGCELRMVDIYADIDFAEESA